MRKDFARKVSKGLGHRFSVSSMRLGRYDLRGLTPEEMEGLPSRIRPSDATRMNKRYHNDRRKLNRGMILRWLNAQVGRKWADVYADLSRAVHENLKGDPEDIRDYARRQVTTNWYWKDGERYVLSNYGGEYSLGGLFVDEDGVLRDLARVSYKQRNRKAIELANKERAKVSRTIGKRQFRKINGAWFELLMDSTSAPQQPTLVDYWKVESVYDVFLEYRIYLDKEFGFGSLYKLRQEYGSSEMYAYYKRTLSHSEAKALGLLDEMQTESV